MATERMIDSAKSILRKRSSKIGDRNVRFHEDTGIENAIRLRVLENGPCNDCKHLDIEENHSIPKIPKAILLCGQRHSIVDRQRTHEYDAPYPQGMFECNDFEERT